MSYYNYLIKIDHAEFVMTKNLFLHEIVNWREPFVLPDKELLLQHFGIIQNRYTPYYTTVPDVLMQLMHYYEIARNLSHWAGKDKLVHTSEDDLFALKLDQYKLSPNSFFLKYKKSKHSSNIFKCVYKTYETGIDLTQSL